MKPLLSRLSALLLIWLAGQPVDALAQDQVTIPRAEYEALKQQAETAKHLQAELDRARAELNRLKPAPPESKSSPATQPDNRPATADKSVPAKATSEASQTDGTNSRRDLTPLPPIDPTAVLKVTDIVQHFAQNPSAATQQYDGKKVRLQGVIAAFDKPALRRDFEIVFRTPAGQLVCRVAPPERFTAVFTTRSGAALTGRTERGAELELLRIGDEISIEGTGQGLKDGSILFTRCKVAGLK